MEPKQLLAIKDALAYGYRVDPDQGVIIGLLGRPLYITCHGTATYPTVTLVTPTMTRRTHTVPVHKIIAYAIWGDAAFQPGIHVRHLDGNPLNVRKDNLALGTPTENAFDKSSATRHQMAKKARASQPTSPPNRILTDDQIRSIRDQCVFGPTGRAKRGYISMWAKRLNVTKSTISMALRAALKLS